jgi:hypothetical protein
VELGRPLSCDHAGVPSLAPLAHQANNRVSRDCRLGRSCAAGAERGTFRGKRTVWGGRPTVRHALYMAALVASRFNPILSASYQRLRKAGKMPKAALVAVMRKLIAILNAMVRDNRI